MLTVFKEKYGCPVVVNTSFNVRGEPIKCTPSEMLIDVLCGLKWIIYC